MKWHLVIIRPCLSIYLKSPGNHIYEFIIHTTFFSCMLLILKGLSGRSESEFHHIYSSVYDTNMFLTVLIIQVYLINFNLS